MGAGVILLDTHVLIWLVTGEPRLAEPVRERIDSALEAAQLAVSAITFWEIAMLQRQGRLSVARELSEWRRALLAAGLEELPLSGEVGVLAAALPQFHADPADRVIVATSLLRHATLVTADERLLQWPGELTRLSAE
jgi:PIN domain nuclease of toxin-antitoxin system